MRSFVAAALLAALAAPVMASSGAAVCAADPLGGRSLYLRGTFNAWAANEAQRFTWACNRWELVARIEGEHSFKAADEGWSADADFGRGPEAASEGALRLRGLEFRRRFGGVQRITVSPASAGEPARMSFETCPTQAPLGATELFLRGTPNNWTALEDNQFLWHCDAYHLNVKLEGRHEFKIADAAWKDGSTFGVGAGNFSHVFAGEHTLRLSFDDKRQPQLAITARNWADPRGVKVTDAVALSLRFDSRALAHKQPFGAVTAGQEILFALSALPGVAKATLVVESRRLEGNQEVLEYTELARVPMLRVKDGARERFSARHRFDRIGIYGYWFELEIGGQKYALQNNGRALHWTREKGIGGEAEVGFLPASAKAVRRLRQTVYSADFKVPEWAPDIVYYYVFPERFRNGNPGNDPVPGVTKYRNKGVEKHARWIEKPFRPGSGDGSDDVHNNDFFGGDLQGLIDKLDEIRELGANTLYMTPIFEAPSNHKYDTADFRRIDPRFGSNADFTRLTDEAGKRGIRVIVDTSLNHTGSDSIYFDRYGNYGASGEKGGAFFGGKPNPASPWFGWYSFDLSQTEPDKQYRGWVGVTDLPELNKGSPGWREFAYRGPDSVTKLWLDRGAAGWRMDVAPWVPDDFWREWRQAVRKAKPDALTVSETWFDSSKYFLGDMFDSTMNYIFRNAVQEFAAGGKAQDMVGQLEAMREAYPRAAHDANMNLLSTHDQARALHLFGWNKDDADAATIERAKQRLKLAVFVQMTYPGAPTVYYGDEVGLTGGDDPDNRRPYPWADQGGAPDMTLRAEFKRLIALRHAEPVLRRGELLAPLYADEHVVVWARRLKSAQAGEPDTWALVAASNASTERRVTLTLPPGAANATRPWRAALGGAALPAPRNGRVTVSVPAGFGGVWVSR
jgi:cyclomaltodextrinase / maltogenic alpha-amylase / neopullulanase